MTEQTEKIMIMRRLVETYSRRSTGLPVLLVVRSAELDSPTTQWGDCHELHVNPQRISSDTFLFLSIGLQPR